jgi:hypothetical protein
MRSLSTFSESVSAKVILESMSNYSMTEHGCTTNGGHNPVAAVVIDVVKREIGDLGSWLGSAVC